MKQYFALIMMAALTASCNSQDVAANKVPAVVINTLTAQYPNATSVEWEKVGADYEADFDADANRDVTVRIDASGNLLMQKSDMGFNELAERIKAVLQNEYKNFKVDEVEKVEKGGVVFYQVELDGKGLRGFKDKQLVFSADGRQDMNTPFWN